MQDLIIFPLLGYYIENRLPEEKQTTSLLIKCTVASIIVLMTSCLLTYHSCTIIGEWQEATCQTFFNTFIIIPTGTVYLGIKMLFMKKTFSETIIKIITVVGSCTFGIYLLEQIYREETIDIYWNLTDTIGSYCASIVWITCAFFIGLVVTIVIRSIPYMKKLI